MYKVKRENLTAVYDRIASEMRLFLPVKKAGEVDFAEYGKGVSVSIDTLKTVRSAKDFFFPQSENMMKFKLEGKNVFIDDIREDKEPFVVFGVRACDFRSFDILDNVFLQDPVDTFYKSRREAAIIVTMACANPEQTCFCNVFGIDASDPKGDISTWLDKEYLYIRVNTEKGQKLFGLIKDLTQPGGEKEVADQQQKTKEIIDKLPFSKLDLSVFKPENLNELFDRHEWAELSQACLGCGACTFVCPTCQCFDIRDIKTHKGVIRFRCWDSCMYSDFTQMAAANPRTTQLQRYRQRFMHKLCYYPSKSDGVYSCVGCGRCVNRCPQHLNIVKVIKKLGGKNK